MDLELMDGIARDPWFKQSSLAVRLVAFAIARHFNPSESVAWPSAKTIASYSGCSRRTVFSSIKAMREAGKLIAGRPLPGWRSSTYRFRLSMGANPAPMPPDGCKPRTPGVQSTHSMGANPAPKEQEELRSSTKQTSSLKEADEHPGSTDQNSFTPPTRNEFNDHARSIGVEDGMLMDELWRRISQDNWKLHKLCGHQWRRDLEVQYKLHRAGRLGVG